MPHKDPEVRRAYMRAFYLARSRQCIDCGARISHGDPKRCVSCSKMGHLNPQYKGSRASANAGRQKARQLYPMPELCDHCRKVKPKDRHHKDGNTLNNEQSNIEFLCRRCHMKEDGRLGTFWKTRHSKS